MVLNDLGDDLRICSPNTMHEQTSLAQQRQRPTSNDQSRMARIAGCPSSMFRRAPRPVLRGIHFLASIIICLIVMGFDNDLVFAQEKVKITVVKILASGDRNGKPQIDAKSRRYKELLKKTAHRQYQHKGESTKTVALGHKAKFSLQGKYRLAIVPRSIEKNIAFDFEVFRGKKRIQKTSGKAAVFIQVLDEPDIKGGDLVLIIMLKKK